MKICRMEDYHIKHRIGRTKPTGGYEIARIGTRRAVTEFVEIYKTNAGDFTPEEWKRIVKNCAKASDSLGNRHLWLYFRRKAMTCSLCGRKLRNEKSQEAGYGPVCYRRMFGSSPKRQRARDRGGGGKGIPCYDIPGQIGIEEYLKSLGNGK